MSRSSMQQSFHRPFTALCGALLALATARAQTTGDADPLIVELRDGTTGAPVAAAAVTVRPVPVATLAKGYCIPRYEAPQGQEHRSDAVGRVSLSRFDAYAEVWAGRGDLAGWTAVHGRASPGPVVLTLWPNQSVKVKVVDDEGRPVGGVPILIERNGRPEHGVRGPVLTDTDSGTATLDQLRVWPRDLFAMRRLLPREVFTLAHGRGDLSQLAQAVQIGVPPRDPSGAVVAPTFDRDDSLRLSFGFPCASSARRILPLGRPLPGEIVLRMPPVGQVLVVVEPRTDAVSLRPWGLDWLREATSQRTEAGVLFQRIGVGALLNLHVGAFGEHDSVERRLSGPTRPRETVRVELRAPGYESLVTGIVRVSDRPRPDQRVVLVRHLVDSGFDGRMLWEDVVRADGAGRFRFECVPGPYGWSHDATDAALCCEDGAGTLWSWRVTLPWTELERRHDLGRLEPANADPVLVAGRVVDERGEGVARARVQLSYEPEGHTVDGDRYWSEWDGWAVSCDEQGRFSCRGTGFGRPLGIHAEAEGHRHSEPMRFVPGDTEVVFPMHRTGGLAGAVELDDVDPGPHRLQLHLMPFGALGSETVAVGHVGDDGRFAVDRLPVGRWTVELRAADGEDNPLWRWDDVRIEAGEIGRPHALQRIVLAGRAWATRLVSSGSDDARPFFCRAVRLRQGNPPLVSPVLRSTGGILWSTVERPDLLVVAEGYQPCRLRAAGGEVTLRWKRRPVVHAALVEGARLPAGYRARVQLLAMEDPLAQLPRDPGTASCWLGPGAAVALNPPSPGRYRVQVALTAPGLPGLEPAVVRPAEIVVAEEGVTGVSVTVDGPFRRVP